MSLLIDHYSTITISCACYGDQNIITNQKYSNKSKYYNIRKIILEEFEYFSNYKHIESKVSNTIEAKWHKSISHSQN